MLTPGVARGLFWYLSRLLPGALWLLLGYQLWQLIRGPSHNGWIKWRDCGQPIDFGPAGLGNTCGTWLATQAGWQTFLNPPYRSCTVAGIPGYCTHYYGNEQPPDIFGRIARDMSQSWIYPFTVPPIEFPYPPAPPVWAPPAPAPGPVPDPLINPPLAPMPNPNPAPRPRPALPPNPYRPPGEQTQTGPNPGPRTVSIPLPYSPRPRDDRKFGSRAAYMIWRLFAYAMRTSEWTDLVEALFDALPRSVRRQCLRQGHSFETCVLWNRHLIDWNEAINNIIANEVQDRVIGRLARGIRDVYRNNPLVPQRPFPIGITPGPAI